MLEEVTELLGRRQTKEVGALLPQFYLRGLALGAFEPGLRGLLSEGTIELS